MSHLCRLLAGGALASIGAAQTLIHEFVIADPGTSTRTMATFWTDFDGDGLDDIAIGESHWSGPGWTLPYAGRVLVVSSADGSRLLSFEGTLDKGRFGATVRSVDDVDGDGRPDLAVFEPRTVQKSAWHLLSSSGTGSFRVFSRKHKDLAGLAAGAGDLDGDGVPDLFLSGQDGMYAFSGANSKKLWGPARPGGGMSLAAIGDVDFDGAWDLIAGFPGANDDQGVAVILSGTSGALLRRFEAENLPHAWFGLGVAGLDDLDGDGARDVAIAAQGFGTACPPVLAAFSSRTSVRLWQRRDLTIQSDSTLEDAGDVDGDGSTDLILSVPRKTGVGPAHLTLVSGADGRTLRRIRSDEVQFGGGASGGSDVDLDGQPDFLAPLLDVPFSNQMVVQLWSWD